MKGALISYSELELNWIKACCDLARAEMHALFVQLFGRTDVSVDNLKALCTRKGWTAGPDGRRRNAGKSWVFSAEETAWLRANATLPRAEVAQAFSHAFGRDDVTTAQIVSWRKRNKVKSGRTGRFATGHEPWTKGRKLPFNAASAATQIKPGSRPHNARPIGYESINADGYVMICVDRPNPFRPSAKTHMAFKHRELWEQLHGQVPKGHALKCLDGDKTNCDPSNWTLVPIGLLPRLNGKSGRNYDSAPPELRPLILATAKLEHAAREARKPRGSRA